MKKAKLSDIVGIINKIAPIVLAEPWDNPGLQVGDPTADVERIMVALDPTPAVIDAALAASCQLLVTHHPLIFKPLKAISRGTSSGSLLYKAIRGGLSVVSLHTNYDIVDGGLNDLLADRIGLVNGMPLKVTATAELVKLVVFVPKAQLEQLRSALMPFCVNQGNYRDCTFASGGVGTFTPLAGAGPFIGTVGDLTLVEEERLELLIPGELVSRAIKVVRAVHPYEEPAYDLYPLRNEGEKRGLGRIGRLAEPLPLAEYAAFVGQSLAAPLLRYVGDPAAVISKVALCSGGGASLLRDAVRAGADLLVTGDVKYHEARDAEDAGVALIDAGHFSTEIIMVNAMKVRLEQELARAGFTDCPVEECSVECDPFRM